MALSSYNKAMYPKIGIFDSYSLMLLVGLLSVWGIVEFLGRKKNVGKKTISFTEIGGIIAVIFGLIGAVLLQNLYDFIEKGSAYKWTWAMTFYGGLLFGVPAFLAFYFLCIRKKCGPCMKGFVLLLAPASIASAQGFGRIGCFLAGCCYGRQTSSWIGVHFPNVEGKVIPTNLLEAIFLLLLAIALLALALSKWADWCFPAYLFSYSIWRFAIEFFRGDHRGDFIPGISPSQFWSIVLFVIGIGYTVFLLWEKKKAAKGF